MSSADVELVRRSLEEFIRTHEFDPETTHPDFVWESIEGWPGKREFHGVDDFMEFFREWIDPYEEVSWRIERVEDLSGGRVLILATQRGRLRGSASWLDFHYGAIYTVEDRLVTRIKAFATQQEALAAAGLAE